MRMGNALTLGVRDTGMSTGTDPRARPAVGLAHPTVVPTNYDPEDEEDGDTAPSPTDDQGRGDPADRHAG